ncbi:MAG: hypothetical protein RLZZ437_1581 [Pseudomonadota bacterium]|jgi:hypothetical protein
MLGYADAPEAWGRAQRMAQARRLNLAAAVVDGWLNRSELGELVDQCRTCLKGVQCNAWVSDHRFAPAVPAFCANKPLIEALAP